jgi:hypothetical protein
VDRGSFVDRHLPDADSGDVGDRVQGARGENAERNPGFAGAGTVFGGVAWHGHEQEARKKKRGSHPTVIARSAATKQSMFVCLDCREASPLAMTIGALTNSLAPT